MTFRTLFHAVLLSASGCCFALCTAVRAETNRVALPAQAKANAPRKSADLRREITAVLSSAFPSTALDRRKQAERLLSLYTQAQRAKALPPSEHARLQARMKSRLTRLASAIERDTSQPADAARSLSQAATPTSEKPGERSPLPPVSSGSAGGAPQDDGQALVELIQATIAPQSWDVNGGPGTIIYWPAWHVLVVRQTDDVHEQIGGVARNLRK